MINPYDVVINFLYLTFVKYGKIKKIDQQSISNVHFQYLYSRNKYFSTNRHYGVFA